MVSLLSSAGAILGRMEKPRPDDQEEPEKRSPFERFVAAIAKVPKAEVDAAAAAEAAEPRRKRGPKPKPAA
jgi:hypothetical protein